MNEDHREGLLSIEFSLGEGKLEGKLLTDKSCGVKQDSFFTIFASITPAVKTCQVTDPQKHCVGLSDWPERSGRRLSALRETLWCLHTASASSSGSERDIRPETSPCRAGQCFSRCHLNSGQTDETDLITVTNQCFSVISQR